MSWLASYALVFQLVLGAFAGAQLSAQAAGQNWTFFEICFGKVASEGQLPDGVPARDASKCAVCVLATSAGAVLAPEAGAITLPAFVSRVAQWQWHVVHPPHSDAALFQKQRAPPTAA